MNEHDEKKGMMKFESVQFFFRKHWTDFLKPFVVGLLLGFVVLCALIALGAFIVILKISAAYPAYGYLSMIVMIFVINVFFLQLINFYFNIVIVTNHRILLVHKTVFLENDNDAIDLTKVQDFGVTERGILRNYLNYGTLVITLSTSTPPLIIPQVPNPHYFLELMNKVKREYIIERQERRAGQNFQSLQPKSLEYLKDIDTLGNAS